MMSLMNTDFHKNLSNYFESMPLYLDKPTQKKPNTRKLVEQPWQQTKGELWDEVTETLCNLDFIQAKAVAEMTYQLVNDFNAALEVIPDNLKNIDTERARQARIASYTKDLILYSKSEIKALEIPESITSWSEDRIEDEIKRIKQDLNNADKLKGSVLASDAFFPFRDCVDKAKAIGVSEIIQPGGSMRDQESIDACDEHGIAMVFTGRRHFKH